MLALSDLVNGCDSCTICVPFAHGAQVRAKLRSSGGFLHRRLSDPPLILRDIGSRDCMLARQAFKSPDSSSNGSVQHPAPAGQYQLLCMISHIAKRLGVDISCPKKMLVFSQWLIHRACTPKPLPAVLGADAPLVASTPLHCQLHIGVTRQLCQQPLILL